MWPKLLAVGPNPDQVIGPSEVLALTQESHFANG